MSMTPGSQRVLKPGQNDRRLAAGDGSRGGGARKSPTGRRFERGLLLQLASARAHLVVAAFGRRVAGIEPGDELRRRRLRSSAKQWLRRASEEKERGVRTMASQ